MFNIPSLKDSVERVRRSMRTQLPGTDAYIWPNNLNPVAKVFGGLTHEIFGFADYIRQQIFAQTADSGNLDMHGGEYGLPRNPASAARGAHAVTITAQGAFSAAVGAILQRSDGVEYAVTDGGSIVAAGDVTVSVLAATNGKAGNCDPGTSLALVSGFTDSAGAATALVNSVGISLGADVEGDEDYRARILFRKRNPPHGGSAADYVMWAGQVAGVTRVFVERLWSGSGTVRVFPLMDEVYPNGIADAGAIATVAEHLSTVQPAGAIVTVAAPVATPIDVTIQNLSPDTPAVREAVLAELRAGFFRLGRVAGIDTQHGGMPYLAVPATFSRSWIWQAIANASGEERHILAAPAADVAIPTGHIATLGNVTFI